MGCVATLDHRRRLNQRMKQALMQPAYNAWKLNGDDLDFFDRLDQIDDTTLRQNVNLILRRAIDRDVTLCQLRRRTDAVNLGRLAFLDATYNGDRQYRRE